MNDLIRPTLYDAYHDIKPVVEPAPGRRASSPTWSARSARPGDYLALAATCRAEARRPPRHHDGRRLWGRPGGTYNTRPLVPEVLVRGADAALVRPRPTYDELIGLDRVPDWLA